MYLSVNSSFRDPESHIYKSGNGLVREITPAYMPVYRKLMDSGLYQELLAHHLIIPHTEVWDGKKLLIKPQVIFPITYPYEWAFSQLKEAALATLEICQRALEHGLILKDASAFNIQWQNTWKHNHFLLMDTGSFSIYDEGKPWLAYGQFLRHFLCPLVLTSYGDVRGLKTLQLYLDGMPVAAASRLLPFKSFLSGAGLHIHPHRMAKSGGGDVTVSLMRLKALLANLVRVVDGLKYKPQSDWLNYEPDIAYSNKKWVVLKDWLKELADGNDSLLDIGTNNGNCAELASDYFGSVIAIDREHDCIERIAKESAQHLYASYLPLVVDITNPTPAVGWANTERDSFIDRVKTDVVTGLAVLHHICIGNNVPLAKVSDVMAKLTKKWLIMEFVSCQDDNSRKIGHGKIYPCYDETIYTVEFARHFDMVRKENLTDCRSLWLWRKK